MTTSRRCFDTGDYPVGVTNSYYHALVCHPKQYYASLSISKRGQQFSNVWLAFILQLELYAPALACLRQFANRFRIKMFVYYHYQASIPRRRR